MMSTNKISTRGKIVDYYKMYGKKISLVTPSCKKVSNPVDTECAVSFSNRLNVFFSMKNIKGSAATCGKDVGCQFRAAAFALKNK